MSLEKTIRVALREAGIPIEKDKFDPHMAQIWILGRHEWEVAKDALIEAGLTVEGTDGAGRVFKIVVWQEADSEASLAVAGVEVKESRIKKSDVDRAIRILSQTDCLGWSETDDAPDVDEEVEEEESLCGQCNGSGEGMRDGTRCSSCGGSGVKRRDWDGGYDGDGERDDGSGNDEYDRHMEYWRDQDHDRDPSANVKAISLPSDAARISKREVVKMLFLASSWIRSNWTQSSDIGDKLDDIALAINDEDLSITGSKAGRRVTKDSLSSLFDGADLRYILNNNDPAMVVSGKDGKDYAVTKLDNGMYEIEPTESL